MLRNRNLLWLGCGALMALVVYSSFAGAQGPGGHHGFGPPHGPPGPFRNMMIGHMGRMMVLQSNLDVTHDQHSKLFGILKAHHAEAMPVAKKLSTSLQNLRDKVISDNPQEAEIRAMATELGNAIGDAAVLASKGVKEAKAVMTPEQLALIKKFIADEDQAHDKFLEQMKNPPNMHPHKPD